MIVVLPKEIKAMVSNDPGDKMLRNTIKDNIKTAKDGASYYSYAFIQSKGNSRKSSNKLTFRGIDNTTMKELEMFL